jgi:hypothetical protein
MPIMGVDDKQITANAITIIEHFTTVLTFLSNFTTSFKMDIIIKTLTK